MILTHKHLDHSADVNVMIEAISEGGYKPRGVLLAPTDCFNDDPVVLKYNRKYLKEFIQVSENFEFEINGINIKFPVKHNHGVETYGLRIKTDDFKLSHIADTKYFDRLIPAYKDCDILIMNMVFGKPKPFLHLSYEDVIKLINGIQPTLAVITHFGYNLWQEKPESYEKKIKKETGVNTLAATDGLILDLEEKKVL